MSKINVNNETDLLQKAQSIAETLTHDRESATDTTATQEWLSSNEFAGELLNQWCNIDELTESVAQAKYLRNQSEQSTKRLKERLYAKQYAKNITKKQPFRTIFTSMSAAAIIAVSILIYITTPTKQSPQQIATSTQTIDITAPMNHPSTINEPTLVLNDGKQVNLSSNESNNKLLIADVNVAISRIDYSKNIAIKSTSISADSIVNNAISYNTLLTPAERFFNITLPDGSEVCLNASSQLRYPTEFIHNKREVFLTGEAYFKVTKSDKPFIVHCDDNQIIVYGTEFNINSYKKENIKTILVSGSVGVKLQRHNQPLILKPNQMLNADLTNGFNRIQNVNTKRYTAWTSGYFRCDNEPLSVLLEDISNWYNVNFSVDQAHKHIYSIKISASLKRAMSLKDILSAIETLSNIKFTQEKGGQYSIE